MELIDFIRSQADAALRMLAFSVEDLDDEVAHYPPGGTANSIAQILAHVVTGQDLLIADRIGGGTSLHESSWAEKTGIPLDRVQIWDQGAWRLNMEGFEAYRQAVEAQSRRFLDTLTPADLDKQYAWIRGPEQPVARLMQTIFINHALGHAGEISALKGTRGLKGLPI